MNTKKIDAFDINNDENNSNLRNVLEKVSGHIERITFHNAENGFCVIRLKARGHKDLVTLTGNAININVGEYVEASGTWFRHTTYGLQFKAEFMSVAPPTTLDGIEKYLASGMIKGIGPYFAKKLVKMFGENIFDVIEEEPELLFGVEGIGEKRQEMILTSWSEQKAIRSIMLFLQSHGVGTARAVRIYKTYGEEAIDKVRENPYRLAQDIYGIGFKTADSLAQKLGIPFDSLIRARAGVRYSLQEISKSGHCACTVDTLINKSAEILQIDSSIITMAIIHEVDEKNLIVEEVIHEDKKQEIVYLASFFVAEVNVAKHLVRLNQGDIPWKEINCAEAIPWAEKISHLKFSSSQIEAITKVLSSKVTVITGGPGVGKTTIINSIVKIIKATEKTIALCAPTGRASKRLSETTGLNAKTIHRLLKFDPKTHSFIYDINNPLTVDFLVVDEASMIDIMLMQSLLRAIPDHTALLIVGDVDQLPSVGAGNVLKDIIQSEVFSVIELKEIFRQASNSLIITNAHKINKGEYPIYKKDNNADFQFIDCETAEEIHENLLNVVTKYIPENFGFDPIKDIQVLVPMNRGGLGTQTFNIALQDKLNPNRVNTVKKFGWVFAEQDKVMQYVNNYDKDVFNGDIGTITEIDAENSNVKINFDNNIVNYDFNELDEITLAYATSIHKSQGSEYPAIVIPLATQHYMMLARNLLYTAVTRGKKLVIIIGQKKALAMAVKNNRTTQRLTRLAERIKGYVKL